MKIFDPVHGFIHLTPLEVKLVDSPAFQRLRYIRQLGIAFLVYPGATHTRFEHSLGTMHLATAVFDRLKAELEETEYYRQIVRFAALCHDLGHLPFSHVAEHALLGEKGHEALTWQAIEGLQPLWEEVRRLYPGKDVLQDVLKCAIGEQKLQEMGFTGSWHRVEKIVSQIVTADFFGTDRIDYLLRDAKCTGVSYGLFDYCQLLETICILGDALGIEEAGIEACEALLLARHFMHRRVYQHPTVRSYARHLARFMQLRVDPHVSTTDDEVLALVRSAALDEKAPGHLEAKALMNRSFCQKVEEEGDSPKPRRESSFRVRKKDGTLVEANLKLIVNTRGSGVGWESCNLCL